MPESPQCTVGKPLVQTPAITEIDKIVGHDITRELSRAKADQAVGIARYYLESQNTPAQIKQAIIDAFFDANMTFELLDKDFNKVSTFVDSDECREYFKAKLKEIIEAQLQDAS